MDKEPAPTFEEYKELVKQHLKSLLFRLSDRELTEYIESEDSIFEIKNSYNTAVEKYKTGEITYRVFTVGCVSSVTYCLYMMY